MYAVGTTGDGSAATPLFATPLVTDADGRFDYAGAYVCPSADALIYMVATGGSTNSQIGMMTALGRCGDLTPTTNVTINEVTTVAAVWSLAPYMQGAAAIGAGNNDQQALAAAFRMALILANPTTGTAPGANAPDDATLPVGEINTLADILASCVDSTGGTAGDGSKCGTLYQATTPVGGNAPTDTLSAALMLANNPALGTTTLFGLLPATPPFQPVLTAAPASFALPTTFPSGVAVALSPSSFPDTSLGQSSQAVLTVTNNGTSAVHLSEPVLSGENAAQFNFDMNGPNSPCSTSAALAAGASCTITVTFSPMSEASKTADLAIVSDAQNGLIHVALSGKGVQAAPPGVLTFSYTPDIINFDQYGVAKTLTVTNTGNEAFNLTITPTYWTGPQYPVQDGSGWGKAGTCIGSPIAAGASCTLSLKMYEYAGLPRVLTLTAQAGADSTSQAVALSVTSVASLGAKPIDFGGWPVNQSSTPHIVTLGSPTNTLILGTVTGPNAQDFVADCETTLNQCSIGFTPSALGTRTATLETQYGEIALTGTGQQAGASMTISVSSLTTQPPPIVTTQPPPVGGNASLRFTVVNNGSTNLTLAKPSFGAQTDTSVFSFPPDPDCSEVTLAPARQCTILVAFKPTQPGTQPVTVQVQDTTSGLIATKSYLATALNGNLPLPSDSIDFGVYALGSTTTWGVSIPPTQMAFSAATGGNGSENFTLKGSPCDQSNPPKYFCGYSVVFQPSATGVRTTSFVLTDVANNKSTTLTVRGTGVVTSLQLSSNSITFPATPLGTSSPQTITVKNNGTVPANTAWNLFGPNSAMYSAGPPTTCGGNIPPGYSCTIGVVFQPTLTGPHDGTMLLAYETVISLQGTGTDPTTEFPFSISPTSLTFEDETVGFTGPPKALTITNTGSTAIDVTAKLLDEQGQVESDVPFSYVSSTIACSSLRPGASCRIDARFSPKETGVRTPSLVFYSTPTGVRTSTLPIAQAVALRGQGIAPAGGPLTLSPSGGLFFSQIGTAQTASLENDGDTPVSIRFINYPDNNCGTELAAHAQCQIQVDGTLGDVNVYATSSSTPYTLPVSVPPGQDTGLQYYIAFQATPLSASSSIAFDDYQNVSIVIFPGANASDFSGGFCSTPDIRLDCSAALQFKPGSTGLETAMAGVTSGFNGSFEKIYKVFGIGGSLDGADFAVSQNDFPGKIVPGYVGTVTLTNTGTTPLLLYQDNSNNAAPLLSLESSTVPGCNLNRVVQPVSYPSGSYQNGKAGIYLPAGQSCTVIVSLVVSPGTGVQTQELRFTDALSGLSKSQTLTSDTGTAMTLPTISDSTGVGTIAIGATTVPVTFTINAPNGEGVIVSVSSTSPSNGVTYVLDTGSCAQKTPCQATLTATPLVAGSFSLSLMAYDPLTGLTNTSSLGGTAGFPTATFSPATIDFGNQSLGVQSTAHYVTVRNTGQSSLNITNVRLLSDMVADFSTDIRNCTQGNIAVGGSCTISIYFTPHATGTRTGILQLIDNEQTPARLMLTGESLP